MKFFARYKNIRKKYITNCFINYCYAQNMNYHYREISFVHKKILYLYKYLADNAFINNKSFIII